MIADLSSETGGMPRIASALAFQCNHPWRRTESISELLVIRELTPVLGTITIDGINPESDFPNARDSTGIASVQLPRTRLRGNLACRRSEGIDEIHYSASHSFNVARAREESGGIGTLRVPQGIANFHSSGAIFGQMG
jgi:hypothetical protein